MAIFELVIFTKDKLNMLWFFDHTTKSKKTNICLDYYLQVVICNTNSNIYDFFFTFCKSRMGTEVNKYFIIITMLHCWETISPKTPIIPLS